MKTLMASLAPQKRPFLQCLHPRCGFSYDARQKLDECPRCRKDRGISSKLTRFPTEQAGWKAFHRANPQS